MDNGIFPILLSVDVWFHYVWNNNNNANDSLHFVSKRTIKEVVLINSKAQKQSMISIAPERHAGKEMHI